MQQPTVLYVKGGSTKKLNGITFISEGTGITTMSEIATSGMETKCLQELFLITIQTQG